MDDRRTSTLDLFPSIMVNNRTFIGSWEPKNILEMICAGFHPSKVPTACFTEGVFSREKKVSQSLSIVAIIAIVVAIIVINVILYILCRRYVIKKINDKVESNELDDQISTVVSRYMAMRETKL